MAIDREHFVFIPGLKDGGKPLVDFRTIPLRAVLKLDKLPALPAGWDAHEAVGGVIDNNMFGNDEYGCCVIAAVAHETLTFEVFEQDILIPITTKEVVDEYFRQSHGRDTGLLLTSAMKEWRNTGWIAGGKHYNIHAFAGVEPRDHTQVKYSIFLFNGIIFGMLVFSTDIDQFRKGEPWHLTPHNGAFEGGHGVYGFRYYDEDSISFYLKPGEVPHGQGTGYANFPLFSKILSWNEKGLWCITWGEEQFMTWDFWDARVNQSFAIIDNRNKWLDPKKSSLNLPLLSEQLELVTGQKQTPVCKISETIRGIFH